MNTENFHVRIKSWQGSPYKEEFNKITEHFEPLIKRLQESLRPEEIIFFFDYSSRNGIRLFAPTIFYKGKEMRLASIAFYAHKKIELNRFRVIVGILLKDSPPFETYQFHRQNPSLKDTFPALA